MSKSKSVFVVQHVIEEYDSEPKLLGVYHSQTEAENAVQRFKSRIGFRNFKDGFSVDQYELDKDYWETGFSEQG